MVTTVLGPGHRSPVRAPAPREGRTATPALRSRSRTGGRRGVGRSRSNSLANRATATSGSTSPRPSRPSQATQHMASTATTALGANHHRISTLHRVVRRGDNSRRPRRANSRPHSGRPHPLLVPVVETLVLPHRHLRLQGVDQGSRSRKGCCSVRRRRRHHHRKVAHRQRPDAVDSRDPTHVVLRDDPVGDCPQPLHGTRMGRVVQPLHAPATVVVADPTDEDRQRPRRRMVEGVHHLTDRQRSLTQTHQPNGVTGTGVSGGHASSVGRSRTTHSGEPPVGK